MMAMEASYKVHFVCIKCKMLDRQLAIEYTGEKAE